MVIVHGLGGNSQSPYTLRASQAADRAGLSHLRLNLRGADLRGDDLYHAGLGSDINAVLAAPELADFDRIVLLGYSMGGHVCLAAAAQGLDKRVTAMAALCSPLHLATSATAFDRPGASVYRRHILDGLKQMYSALVARRPHTATAPLADIKRIDKLWHWDELVTAPRHGFASVEQYYETQSASNRLQRINRPCLILHATADPMVPIDTVRPFLSEVSKEVEVREVETGGHVGFPEQLHLGLDAEVGLEPQVLRWLLARGQTHPDLRLSTAAAGGLA